MIVGCRGIIRCCAGLDPSGPPALSTRKRSTPVRLSGACVLKSGVNGLEFSDETVMSGAEDVDVALGLAP